MTRIIPALDDYGNAWVTQYMYLGIYRDCAEAGNQKGMEKALIILREDVEKPKEYQKSFDIKFEPDFSKSQEHRLNCLAEMYNHMAKDDNPDVEAMYRVAEIPMKLIRKWANPSSSRMGL